MAAMTPFHPLDGYGTIEIRSGGSSPTVTYGAFVKRDTTNHGVIDSADGGTCCGISRQASSTADETITIATGGVWKTVGTASESLEPGDVFYIGSNVTVSTGSQNEVSQGLIVQSTTASGATVLYILLVPSEIYTATTHA